MQTFPDPFQDYSGMYMPRDVSTMLRWCEILWGNNGTYRTAMERVVTYFLTQVEILDVSDGVRKRYLEFLNDMLKVISQIRMVGMDMLFYGNSFSSVFMPFRRYLRCSSCKFEQPIEEIVYEFKKFKFFGICAKCRAKGELDVVDRRSMEQDRLRVVRWSPHQMEMLFHPISHSVQYIYNIPSDFRRHIADGLPFYVRHTPWEFVEAIRDNKPISFYDNIVFHGKEETLAGLPNRGWGIPRALSNFKQGFYVQVLKRYNEAIALDYIMPWRLITPAARGSGVDPALHINLGAFSGFVDGMVQEHRRDPLAIHSLPFPVEYQMLGGEARELAPHELMTVGLDELLNACGVPAELYKGTLQTTSFPPAIRMFESTWPHLVAAYNNWLNWLLEQIAVAFNWERARGRMTPVTLADDIEARILRLNLAAAGKISDTTALSSLGLDLRDEVQRVFEEQKMREEEAAKSERERAQRMEMERRMAETSALRQGMLPGAGPMTGPGVPPGVGPGGGLGAPGTGPSGLVTPSDVMDQAAQIAQQLLAMPEAQRRRQLSSIRQADATLHAAVKQQMTNYRGVARSVGQEQVLAEMSGGAAY